MCTKRMNVKGPLRIPLLAPSRCSIAREPATRLGSNGNSHDCPGLYTPRRGIYIIALGRAQRRSREAPPRVRSAAQGNGSIRTPQP